MKTLDIMAIPLTQGLFALVDGKNYEWLNQWNWCVEKQGNTSYASRWIYKNGKRTTIRMHQQILKTPEGMQTDHRNLNGFDNRRYNIRECTHSQNQQNQRKGQNTSSQFKGVSYQKGCGKWHAYINKNGKRYNLGFYNDEVAAAKAYDKMAEKLFGEFARANF